MEHGLKVGSNLKLKKNSLDVFKLGNIPNSLKLALVPLYRSFIQSFDERKCNLILFMLFSK